MTRSPKYTSNYKAQATTIRSKEKLITNEEKY